jgi:outer membrane protein assembly factor BamB
MRDHLLRGLALLCLLALAGCTQPTSVPSGGPPTPIVLRTPLPTATPIPPAPIPPPAPPAPLSVYVALSNQFLVALDASTGALRWKQFIGEVASLVLVNNVLYVGTGVGVYALNALDGSTRWHQASDPTPVMGLAVQNNIVYTASQAGNIQALNASDGDLRWGTSVGFQLNSLTLDGGRLFASSHAGALAAWDVNGTMLWIQQVDGVSFSQPVAGNGLLYLVENLSDPSNPALPHLAAYSEGGQPIWDIVPGHGGLLATPIVAADGFIYTADEQGLYAIDPLKGATRWQVQTSTTPQSAQHRLAAAGNVVALCSENLLPDGTSQGKVQAYSLGEGKPYWQTTLEAGAGSSPSCQTLGEVFIVESLGRLYALSSSNGSPLWENRLNDSALSVLAAG